MVPLRASEGGGISGAQMQVLTVTLASGDHKWLHDKLDQGPEVLMGALAQSGKNVS